MDTFERNAGLEKYRAALDTEGTESNVEIGPVVTQPLQDGK